jgi:hypothetical protein
MAVHTEFCELAHRHTLAQHLVDVLAQRADEPIFRLRDHLERRLALCRECTFSAPRLRLRRGKEAYPRAESRRQAQAVR